MDKIPEEEPHHVFEDRSGIRGKVVVVLLAVLAVVSVVWLWDLGRRLLIDMPLDTAAALPEGTARPVDAFVTLQTNAARPCARDAAMDWSRQRLVLGYLPAADSTSLSGLRSRCDQLDRVLADAFLLGAPDGTVVPLWAGRNAALQDLADQIGLPGGSALTVARITASTRTDELAALLSPGPALDRMIGQLAGFLDDQPRPGLCLDLAAHPELDPAILREALSRLSRAVALPGRLPTALCLIAGPEAALWRDPALVAMLDLAVVKAFREAASPIVAPAPPDWFDAALGEVRRMIPGPKLVVALGSFGQVWESGQARSLRISYAETLARAERAGTPLRFDPASGATRVRYLDDARQVNDIWLMDAATILNQLAALPADQSVAIWPLGYEDPGLWPLLHPDPTGRPPALRLDGPVDLSRQVLTEIGGPAVGAILPAEPGARRVTADPSGLRVVAQDYAPLPLPNRVLRRGIEVPGGLVLAFDGLPGARDVDGLIATLSKTGIKAVFFADLRMLLLRGASAKRLAAAGHVLGLRLLPPLPGRTESQVAARMQLNFAQLYLAETFDRPARLILLRPGAGPPQFSRDAFAAEAELIRQGLIPVRSSFDAPFGPVDANEFVDRILREGGFDQTQVVTLDLRESGSDQLAALPALLTRLIGDGFLFLAPDLATRADLPRLAAPDLPDRQMAMAWPSRWRTS